MVFILEFLLGNTLLVAPVLEQGAVARDIYLPRGIWKDENRPYHIHNGPTLIKDYSAGLDILPFFTLLEEYTNDKVN